MKSSHRVCACVQYWQMLYVCIWLTYADAGHMYMLDISCFLSFSAEIRKKVKPDLNEIA